MPPKPKEAPPVEPPAPSERELERRKETREVIEQSFQDIDSLVWSQVENSCTDRRARAWLSEFACMSMEQVLLLAEIAHDVDEFNRFKDEEAIAPKIDIRAPGSVPVKRRTKSPTKPAAPLLRRSLSTRSVTRVDVPPHTAVQPIKPPAVVASAATKPMRPPSAKTGVSAPAVNGAGRPQSAKSPARAADRSGAASRPQSAGSPVRAPAKPRPSTAPPKRTTGAS